MNTILRNLFYTLRRFRTASRLNLLGLSAAFAAFVVMMMKVGYERSFNTCYPEADRIAILDINIDEEPSYFGCVLPRGFLDYVIGNTPGIECGSIYAKGIFDVAFCTDPDNPAYFQEEPCAIYKDFADVVSMTFVEGNADGMDAPDGMLLSETLARKFFPDGNAVGSYVYRDGDCWIADKNITKYRVCGVYKDFPENSQFADNPLFIRMSDFQKDDWGSYNFYCFLRLKPGVTSEDIKVQIEKSGANRRMAKYSESEYEGYVIPLTDLYYSHIKNDFLKTGSKQNLYLLVSIALLIIAVASINLINFSTALTPMRIRSINTQKVLGSSVASLRAGLVGEAVCITFLSWIISLLLILALDKVDALSFLDFTPSLSLYWKPVAVSGAISLLVGILAGIYPAFYMTSFPPALMLKGNYALSGKGKQLRTLLIGFQYVISFILIVATIFIYLQNDYMRQYRLGIDRDNLIVAYLPNLPINGSMYQGFDQQVKSYPEIADVAYAGADLGGMNVYSTYPWSYKDISSSCFLVTVSPNFCRTMGIKITEGRDFLPNDSIRTDHLNFIVTQNAKKAINIPVGESFDFSAWGVKGIIVGYANDVRFTSLHTEDSTPFVFVTNPFVNILNSLPYAYIRVKAGSNMDEALTHIRCALADNFTGYSIDIKFFDQVYASLYQRETNQQYMVTLFSLLAVIISVVGVFGLVIFEAEYRRKEIGIRKVYGATTGEILWMFNRFYLRLVVICFAISVPVTYYVVGEWLKDFSDRIGMAWWVFALAFLVISLITLLTITIQNYRTASSNPVDSIKSE